MIKLNEKEKEEIAAKGFANPGYFCRVFLSHWFSLPMPWVHRGFLALLTRKTDWLLEFGPETWAKAEGYWDEKQLDKILRHFVWRPEPDNPEGPEIPLFQAKRDSLGKIYAIDLLVSKRILAIMPRGISKTTLVNASNIYDSYYHEVDFLVYLSEAATHAEMQLENVKREIESNSMLIEVFGQKKPERTDSEKWREDFAETTDGFVIAAKGRGSQVRGLNHKGKRPKKIVIDDVEDAESVKNDVQRKKALSWLKADVEPALPQIVTNESEEGIIVATGTILSAEAMLVSLMNDPEWVTVRFGAMDPDGDPLWDHYMTRDEYDRKKRSFARLGKLAEFNREYASTTKMDKDQAKFPLDLVRYQIMVRADFEGVALVMDPAIGQKKDSDYCAYGVTGITSKGQIHVLECHMERGMLPDAQIDKYFELNGVWRPTKRGIEAVAYQKSLIHLVRAEQFKRSQTWGAVAYFEVIPILHGNTAKIPRVEGVLSPRWTAGYVTLQRRFPELEVQLGDWPNGKKDGPDVIAMCVTLLDPYAAFNLPGEIGEDGQHPLAKDEYPALEEELGNWRSAP